MVRKALVNTCSGLDEYYMISHIHLYMGNNRGGSNLIFLTPFLGLFCNSPPHSWYEPTQFSSKTFRGSHLLQCGTFSWAQYIILYIMMWCTSALSIHTSWLHKRQNKESLVCQDAKDMNFHPKYLKNSTECFQFFILPL